MKTIKGVDTTFLIQLEVPDLPQHLASKLILEQVLEREESLGISSQVLFEFIHVVTDPKRFKTPLTVTQAIDRAKFWWEAEEVEQFQPTEEVITTTFEWLRKFNLGRKRLLDTQLAATYFCGGVQNIITSNHRDFSIFGCFNLITP